MKVTLRIAFRQRQSRNGVRPALVAERDFEMPDAENFLHVPSQIVAGCRIGNPTGQRVALMWADRVWEDGKMKKNRVGPIIKWQMTEEEIEEARFNT